ncbi:ABC transporter ATP-binding protein [Candidatus Woesearchaeota archaeon]|nr:ABC transporter ATP-binding protein [Candidatus Woesearchaeota archaeon]
MDITKTKINHCIYLLKFKSSKEASKTMLRFEEYYESPKFRGKTFSLPQFRKWYAEQHGSFSYYHDWDAFNFPGRILLPFFKGKFNPLSRAEKKVLNLFQEHAFPRSRKDFYIVAASRRVSRDTLRHELAHALFYTVPGYRKKVLRILKRYDIGSLKSEMISKGYNQKVVLDEVHAWTIGTPRLLKNKAPSGLRGELLENYRNAAQKTLHSVAY